MKKALLCATQPIFVNSVLRQVIIIGVLTRVKDICNVLMISCGNVTAEASKELARTINRPMIKCNSYSRALRIAVENSIHTKQTL
jgi:uncharacterized protein YaaN involved in tellurite resistance